MTPRKRTNPLILTLGTQYVKQEGTRGKGRAYPVTAAFVEDGERFEDGRGIDIELTIYPDDSYDETIEAGTYVRSADNKVCIRSGCQDHALEWWREHGVNCIMQHHGNMYGQTKADTYNWHTDEQKAEAVREFERLKAHDTSMQAALESNWAALMDAIERTTRAAVMPRVPTGWFLEPALQRKATRKTAKKAARKTGRTAARQGRRA